MWRWNAVSVWNSSSTSDEVDDLAVGVVGGGQQVLDDVAAVLGRVADGLAEPPGDGEQHELADVVLAGGGHRRERRGRDLADRQAPDQHGAGGRAVVDELAERVVDRRRQHARRPWPPSRRTRTSPRGRRAAGSSASRVSSPALSIVRMPAWPRRGRGRCRRTTRFGLVIASSVGADRPNRARCTRVALSDAAIQALLSAPTDPSTTSVPSPTGTDTMTGSAAAITSGVRGARPQRDQVLGLEHEPVEAQLVGVAAVAAQVRIEHERIVGIGTGQRLGAGLHERADRQELGRLGGDGHDGPTAPEQVLAQPVDGVRIGRLGQDQHERDRRQDRGVEAAEPQPHRGRHGRPAATGVPNRCPRSRRSWHVHSIHNGIWNVCFTHSARAPWAGSPDG